MTRAILVRCADRQRQGMHPVPQLVRKHGEDEALALDARFSREGRRGDQDAEMRLAARPRAGMADMHMRLIDHVEMHGCEGLFKFASDRRRD